MYKCGYFSIGHALYVPTKSRGKIVDIVMIHSSSYTGSQQLIISNTRGHRYKCKLKTAHIFIRYQIFESGKFLIIIETYDSFDEIKQKHNCIIRLHLVSNKLKKLHIYRDSYDRIDLPRVITMTLTRHTAFVIEKYASFSIVVCMKSKLIPIGDIEVDMKAIGYKKLELKDYQCNIIGSNILLTRYMPRSKIIRIII